MVVVDIGFGLGLLNLTLDKDIEQYAPTDSTAMKQRELVCTVKNKMNNHKYLITANMIATNYVQAEKYTGTLL